MAKLLKTVPSAKPAYKNQGLIVREKFKNKKAASKVLRLIVVGKYKRFWEFCKRILCGSILEGGRPLRISAWGLRTLEFQLARQ